MKVPITKRSSTNSAQKLDGWRSWKVTTGHHISKKVPASSHCVYENAILFSTGGNTHTHTPPPLPSSALDRLQLPALAEAINPTAIVFGTRADDKQGPQAVFLVDYPSSAVAFTPICFYQFQNANSN
ncbi:hypothetical protein GWI33_020527 [Rhynchophorus ferrugineus]|uniref:Uncharacterized protein n=1 Tax=Rhynchophorus ferrugineus TaxID=354439 RepID=A0A834I396_RHYFE|nr:hypothetical protein GWI33_020527 [Rhynchophorus ferrugineus]